MGSPTTSVSIPNTDIWGLLFERDVPWPKDKVLFSPHSQKSNPQKESQSFTYSSLAEASAIFGASLQSKWSWRPNQVLALVSPNTSIYPAICFGTLWAGGTVLLCNPAYTPSELAYQLKDAGASAIVADVGVLSTVLKAAAEVGIPASKVAVMGGEAPSGAGEVVALGKLMEDGGVARLRKVGKVGRVRRRKGDAAYIVYSSGTTGLPKGVVLSHGNIVAQVLQVVAVQTEITWQQGDVVLAVLPMFHIFGLMMLLHHPLYAGITTIILPSFTLASFCSAVQTHRVTYAYIVPPIMLALGKSPEVSSYDLSTLRTLMSGAAPLTRELIEQVCARFPGMRVKQGYGLSETSPGIAMQKIETWDKTMGSVGPPLPLVSVKLVSPSSSSAPTPVPQGSVGEIWARGPNVFAGYLNNPSATASALTHDGWFRTGDAGYQDADGNIYITDRIKELIKYKGFQVAPAELEGIIIDHPAVADVCVLGVEDRAEATEVPRAYVVPAEKGRGGERELEVEVEKYVRERVVGYKRLRGGVRVVSEIPKSASGKILRRVLKEKVLREEKEGRVKAKL